MAAYFPSQVSAVQVGTFFVGQYYNILQQQPSLVHQFYNEASTMMRIDGGASEAATGMMQIHSLIMSLNFTRIEIKTANFLNSWGDGVLVMVSGLVQAREYNARRNFVQTFFLAPQEKGYFILNDMFHFLDEEQIHQPAIAAHEKFENNLTTSAKVPEGENIAAVPEYMHEGESHSQEYMVPAQVEENGTIPEDDFPEPQQVSHSDNLVEEPPAEEPAASFPITTSFSNTSAAARDPSPVRTEEPSAEPLKQTYASILRAAKGQSGAAAAPLSKPSPVPFEWHQAPQSIPQQSTPILSVVPEKSSSEAVEEVNTLEDEVESKSVYVGNVPPSVTESDLENEFKKFGRIRPDGVAIRSRKDSGGYYAFVEFDDIIGVPNALKASPIEINGFQIYVEERRPNNGIFRGGRRGRGRGGYQSEAPRGRFGGRSFARAVPDYNSRPRGNGFHPRAPRQDRGILGSQGGRDGQLNSLASP
ncbi:putative G3BP-like protein [Ananas comosus]|uniref:Putative G3BP-like protein n=1 Tax=Ananas comosus TaxID=4615 RepID=A0A199URA4_ANACO|nr:putative G3BP-like protein [Ananas comosus]